MSQPFDDALEWAAGAAVYECDSRWDVETEATRQFAGLTPEQVDEVIRRWWDRVSLPDIREERAAMKSDREIKTRHQVFDGMDAFVLARTGDEWTEARLRAELRDNYPDDAWRRNYAINFTWRLARDRRRRERQWEEIEQLLDSLPPDLTRDGAAERLLRAFPDADIDLHLDDWEGRQLLKVEQRRESLEERKRLHSFEVEVEELRRRAPAPGAFNVVVIGTARGLLLPRRAEIIALLSVLPAFRAADADGVRGALERAEHIEPEVVATEVSQDDAIHLKRVLERHGARVKIEHAATVRIGPTREPIPAAVRREVWRRDEGKCVDCGSRERLEFDHIIPVSKGGSNTARNIELRCESCNRHKYANI
jgi:hypothetical protein